IGGAPWCFYPKDYGYNVERITNTSTSMTVEIVRNRMYGTSGRPKSPDIDKLRVEIVYHSSDMFRFKIWDPSTPRYEVPVPLTVPSAPEPDEDKRLYKVTVTDKPFGIQVIRKSTGTKIWDSAVPGFTFSDMFIQVSTRLSSEFVYGFGETEHTTYRHDLNYHTWGMFSKDQPPGMNCYGVHPFYMGLENTADAHGVLLLNSNAMDVTFQPTPALTYRTLGGILDFYMILGPTPEMVVQEYTLIGRPVLPAYWSLGFQLCRYGYKDDTEIKNLYEDMKAAGIPYDVQYADIDYMVRQMDFTLDKEFQGLPAFVDKIRSEGMRFIFMLDPAISGNETNYLTFERGKAQDVFIKWPTTLSDDIVWGKVRGNVAYTAFPDFFRQRTADWWQNEMREYYEKTLKFDGIWIDMNEPASFVHGTVGGAGNCLGNRDLEFPPYMPRKRYTITFNDGKAVRHFDVHSLYGWSHSKPTYDAVLSITGKRGIVVTRSTYPSSGKWVGHWLGDNYSGWDQLYKSIIGMMEFSLFGISYTGADICGFFQEAEYEMCLRWMQLGAFYPYSRNHNAWDDKFAEVSRDVLNIRYTLLPYLYTLMYEAHTEGTTVVRPLLHEFVDDRATWDIHRQFLWGPALMISPALDEVCEECITFLSATKKCTCLYEYVKIGPVLQQCALTPSVLFLFSRKNPLGLLVALDDDGAAQGSLFWDDGEGIGNLGRKTILNYKVLRMHNYMSENLHNFYFSAIYSLRKPTVIYCY
uniref:Maltase n=1 Tax=Salarias fasciatus TaxID=181472 RepID=A0A672GPQ1_SALFA